MKRSQWSNEKCDSVILTIAAVLAVLGTGILVFALWGGNL